MESVLFFGEDDEWDEEDGDEFLESCLFLIRFCKLKGFLDGNGFAGISLVCFVGDIFLIELYVAFDILSLYISSFLSNFFCMSEGRLAVG